MAGHCIPGEVVHEAGSQIQGTQHCATGILGDQTSGGTSRAEQRPRPLCLGCARGKVVSEDLQEDIPWGGRTFSLHQRRPQTCGAQAGMPPSDSRHCKAV